MQWTKRCKTKLVSILLILVLLLINSASSIMAEEINGIGETISTAELSKGTEAQDQSETPANSISGVVWFDENSDGIRGADETPISDRGVYLYSKENLTEEIQKVTTDEEGKYQFSGLEPGEYIVGVKAESEDGYILPVIAVTNDIDNKFTVDVELFNAAYSEVITIADGGIVTDLNCGLLPETEQTDKSEDADADIAAEDEGKAETDQTDNAGEAAVTEDGLETGSEQNQDYAISTDDLEPNTYTNSISGIVWLDENEDGVYDSDENPVEGYEVRLYLASDKSNAVDAVMTDSNGNYIFKNLTPEDYVVGVPLSQTVYGTAYLAPTAGISGANKFLLDETTYNAFTETITIAEDTQASDYGVGVRRSAVISPRAVPSGYTVLTSSMTSVGVADTMRQAVLLCQGTGYGPGDYIITLNADDTDMGTEAVTIPAGYTINLVSNGSTITQTATTTSQDVTYSQQRHFYVSGTLILTNVTLSGVYSGNDSIYSGGVFVSVGGQFTMNGNSSITNCNNYYGGAVYLNNNANMTMSAAAIDKCYAVDGAGVYGNSSSELEMKDESKITNCAARKSGGGVKLNYASISVNKSTIESCSVNNTVYGGGSGGGISGTGNVDLAEATIKECRAYSGGGGIDVSGSVIKMNKSSIVDCVAQTYLGGGISVTGSKLEMSNESLIEGCDAGYFGGGIYSIASEVVLNDSTIRDCEANVHGGGIFMTVDTAADSSTLDMNGSTIEYCKASSEQGGGVLAVYTKITMDNSKIENNESGGNGGGVSLFVAASTLTATSGSISNNKAGGDGGGIYTADYDYASPASTSKYTNINTSGAVAFSGNTASASYVSPSNYADFTNLLYSSKSTEDHILNNYDINYRNSYTINYYTNGGSGTDYSEIIQATGVTYTIRVNSTDANLMYARAGYQFAGWNTEADGSGSVYNEGVTYAISSDLDLYAQWEKEYEFGFTKADAANNSILLEGVEFKLYRWIGASSVSGLVDVSDPGTDWELVNTVTSDANGKVSFTGVIQGSYQLVETQAHSGYQLPAGQWQITVNADGTFGITAVNGSDGSVPPAFSQANSEYILGNYVTSQLPSMGGAGTILFTLLGCALVIVGTIYGFIHFYRKRRIKA